VNKVTLLTAFVLTFIIKLLLFTNLFFVPSSSMEKSVLKNDYILVDKYNIVNDFWRISNPFLRHPFCLVIKPDLEQIPKGEVVVFNVNQETKDSRGSRINKNEIHLKRIFGLPNDTIIIDTNTYNNFIKQRTGSSANYSHLNEYLDQSTSMDELLFPHDSLLKWKYDHLGPIIIPGKGLKIKLTHELAIIYEEVLKSEGAINIYFELTKAKTEDYSVTYTFKRDYYFVLGDNFYNSNDSRLMGFVQSSNILGIAKWRFSPRLNGRKFSIGPRYRMMKIL